MSWFNILLIVISSLIIIINISIIVRSISSYRKEKKSIEKYKAQIKQIIREEYLKEMNEIMNKNEEGK